MSGIVKFTLDNGVRILVESVTHVKSASVGLWCRTGSRHERANEAGITHLIEHMLFKGTESRTSKEIAESIEGRGGSLNAFTDKESTCYYCRVLSDDVENGIDVLTEAREHDPVARRRSSGERLERGPQRSVTDQRDAVSESELGDAQYFRMPARTVELGFSMDL